MQSATLVENIVEHQSVLSDALLRQLMAVGQVDILIGLPTLNNASTVLDIVRAVQVSFTRDFPRLRTVLINSDGGSTDGTPDVIRNAPFSEADMVLTSHPLRTFHRVLAPYHGLPGKLTALHSIFAAVDLTRAKVLVIVDPGGPSTTPERITELIAPIERSEVEFLAPRYCRHPRDGVLVTQLVRPFVRALYGIALDEPLGVEFSCSGRYASHCLERDIWGHEAARFAIDLWLRTEAVAEGFKLGQIWRPATAPGGTRTTLREAVQQVVLALIESVGAHDVFWRSATGVASLPTWGIEPNQPSPAPAWDHAALAEQARHDIGEITPLLEEVLDGELVSRTLQNVSSADPPLDDELWVRTVYEFAAASHRGSIAVEHVAAIFVPLYLWRAAAFMARTTAEIDATVQARLESLSETFQRLKPVLVNRWLAGV